MSVIRSSQYPGRWNTPDADAPQGSGKNRTAPGSNDGSYFDQVWFNDMDSLHQALFIASGVSPNGVQDIGTASQIFDALINNRWSSIGNYIPGSIVTASDGKQYLCKSINGRDTSVVDPSTVTNRNDWVEFPYSETSVSGNSTRIYHDDTVEIKIRLTGVSPGTIPVAFGITISGVSSISESISTTSPVDRSISFIPNGNIDGGDLYYQTTGASTSNVVYINVKGTL